MLPSPDPVNTAIEYTLRQDRGRLIAALVAALGDFELAEECLQDATEAALKAWAKDGIPKSRRGWLLQVARRRAIDKIRRKNALRNKVANMAVLEQVNTDLPAEHHDIADHRLRLIFTCCHPALEQKTQIALTLRLIAGLSTAEIARAFVDTVPAMAARLTRAKAKIRDAGIPFKVPENDELQARLSSVLGVIYLVFNEGYAATQGQGQLRIDLCDEALFLARMMVHLSPDQPEAEGLLALILLTHARRAARQSKSGGYIPLGEQDRGLWDQDMIREGAALIETALHRGKIGPFQLQAAIAALHSEGLDAENTDWPQIAALYRLYARMDANPVVALNLAVARAKVEGAGAGLAALEPLDAALDTYQPYHAARAELLGQIGQIDKARLAYDTALSLTKVTSEREFLAARRDALSSD